MSLLSAEDEKQVAEAIAKVEETTAGEIVVALVPRSDDYDRVRALPVLGVAVALALGAVSVSAAWAAWIVLAQIPVALGLWWLSGTDRVLRLLLSPELVTESIQARAFRLFAERGVHQTRDQSGLLILISELEHRVVILGDLGIHQRLGEQGWNEHVQRLVAAIRAGRARDGLLEVIASLGETLAREFPRRADDTNELPNAVVRE